MDGVIIVDKPQGWTSHDVVGKMRRLAGTKRVGHLGTLDPMATGVLPLVLNRATRLSQFFMKADKVYEALIRFGQATDTYDAEGEFLGNPTEVALTPEMLECHLDCFRGAFQQIPPAISAKKIGGTPAYKLVRKNQPVELKPVSVIVHSLELLSIDGADARFRIHCGSGTYIRSIAHELGVKLGLGSHLAALRRLRAGCFRIEDAHTLASLEELGTDLGSALVPAAGLLPEFPCELVDETTADLIRQGRAFRVSPFRNRDSSSFIKAITESGQLLAIGELRMPNLYHPVIVLS